MGLRMKFNSVLLLAFVIGLGLAICPIRSSRRTPARKCCKMPGS